MDSLKEDEDLSLIAGAIVTNAMQIPRSIFCPFCADEYLFEFTMKDHLKRKHSKELKKRMKAFDCLESLSDEQNFKCPYCQAVFYFGDLLSKHIATSHGFSVLQHWFKTRNSQDFQKGSESSIVYAHCTPDVSQMFDGLLTVNEQTEIDPEQSRLRSILKKTPEISKSGKHCRSSCSRKSRSDIFKRSASKKRELRFDLSPSTPEKTERHINRFSIMHHMRKIGNLFSKKKSHNLVTSTPIDFLDEVDSLKRDKKTRKSKRTQPLMFTSERYGCAFCSQKYDSNANLLSHLKDEHGKRKYLFFPRYRCGQCKTTFFRNHCLVEHCRTKHFLRRIEF